MLSCAAMKRLSFILLLLLFLPSLLLAQALPQPVLALRADTTYLPARGALMLLRDSQGSMTVEQAMAATGWRKLPNSVSEGYTADAVWLRLEIDRAADAPRDWVLRFTNALLDDVRFYRQSSDGGWTQLHSGEDMGRSSWLMDERGVVLPIRVKTAGPETWLVRLKTKNAMATDLEIWTSAAFNDFSRREYLYYGLYFGCYLLLILFHTLFWRMTKEALSGWYLLYVSFNALNEVMTVALPQQVFNMPVGISDPMLGLSICISVAVGAQFSLLQLELPNLWPRFSKIVGVGTTLVSLTGCGLVLTGRYATAMILVQMLALLLIVVFIGISLWLLTRGYRPARFFLLAFGIFYAGVIISFMRNLGWVPFNFWTGHASAIGAFLHMLLMSLRLNLRYNGLRRDKEMAQSEMVRAVRQLNEGLEHQVTKRTLALQQEIARRELLELELRDALEVERRTREEQKDFVAMVSHEFRTPLAIINTTAQQIAKNLDAVREKTLVRCQNLRNAAHRMAALVDEYLTADRMDTGIAAFRPETCDLGSLIDGVLDEWPHERVQRSLQVLPQQFVCDKGLLRVALRNLLTNADRHSPEGCPIRVQAEVQTSGNIRIAVCNEGPPIAADEIPRLFQKYFRGRVAQHLPGAGLGLYLVQRIAAMHAGEVVLENAGHQGVLIFSLLLPERNGLPELPQLAAG